MTRGDLARAAADAVSAIAIEFKLQPEDVLEALRNRRVKDEIHTAFFYVHVEPHRREIPTADHLLSHIARTA